MKFSFKFLIVVALLSLMTISSAGSVLAIVSRRALADVNRDGIISLADKKIVQENLGIINPTGLAALSDVNQDGTISGQDLSSVVKEVGQIIGKCEAADITNDGVVNYDDLNILSAYYFLEANSANMITDITGDGFIDISDLTKMGGLFGCTW